jgi:hypothetical protein
LIGCNQPSLGIEGHRYPGALIMLRRRIQVFDPESRL